jgi:hypothetical protein
MKIEIIGYKIKDESLEIGLYNQFKEPISVFNMAIRYLGNSETNYIFINENSLKSCMACKPFFSNFDHTDYSIKAAIEFMEHFGYVNFTVDLPND